MNNAETENTARDEWKKISDFVGQAIVALYGAASTVPLLQPSSVSETALPIVIFGPRAQSRLRARERSHTHVARHNSAINNSAWRPIGCIFYKSMRRKASLSLSPSPFAWLPSTSLIFQRDARPSPLLTAAHCSARELDLWLKVAHFVCTLARLLMDRKSGHDNGGE